jgi:hypothetical protein
MMRVRRALSASIDFGVWIAVWLTVAFVASMAFMRGVNDTGAGLLVLVMAALATLLPVVVLMGVGEAMLRWSLGRAFMSLELVNVRGEHANRSDWWRRSMGKYGLPTVALAVGAGLAVLVSPAGEESLALLALPLGLLEMVNVVLPFVRKDRASVMDLLTKTRHRSR